MASRRCSGRALDLDSIRVEVARGASYTFPLLPKHGVGALLEGNGALYLSLSLSLSLYACMPRTLLYNFTKLPTHHSLFMQTHRCPRDLQVSKHKYCY